MPSLVHGTCIAIGEAGALLLGPSGSGKSDLALRLIDGGAALVADDQVELTVHHGEVWAVAPTRLPRVLEVRGVGMLPVRSRAEPVALTAVFELAPPRERLPAPAWWRHEGVGLPLYYIDAETASAAARVRALLVRAPVWPEHSP